jgi:uncharacterized protein
MNPEAPSLSSIILFGVLSLITFSIARKRKFFSLSVENWVFPLQWFHVASVFAIYFGVTAVISPIIAKILQRFLFAHPTSNTLLSYASWVNFINSSLILFLILCFLFSIPRILRQNIWVKQNCTVHLFRQDFYLASLGWIISFPIVVFVNQSFDWILSNIFSVQIMPEQIAVYFLKMTFSDPFYLLLAVITIVIFAPIVEEILFRGFLQSFIRQHLGSKQAIFITSVLFAFFHYSPEQGLSNITIIASLFTFSLFLGLVYEKRQALPSPIMLHSLFNAVNVCNLYFLGGIPGGCL